MKMDNFKESFKSFCKRVGKRNFIIFGAVMLVAVAVGVNLIFFANDKKDGFDYDQSAGADTSSQNTLDSGKDTTVSDDDDEYFSSVQISRQQSRDEAIEVLQSVVDNASSTEVAKNEALAEINKMAGIMEAEANIESLVIAKGFEECVAVVSGTGANIVVKSDGLNASQISQINEIVYEQAGILPTNIKIIER